MGRGQWGPGTTSMGTCAVPHVPLSTCPDGGGAWAPLTPTLFLLPLLDILDPRILPLISSSPPSTELSVSRGDSTGSGSRPQASWVLLQPAGLSLPSTLLLASQSWGPGPVARCRKRRPPGASRFAFWPEWWPSA